MAPQTHPSTLPLPSPAQIALALVTVRSKPPHLLIEEHLANIRKCIITQTPNQADQTLKRIDIGQFWKDAFLRSESEKQKLQDEIVILRQQAITNQVQDLSSAANIVLDSRKRKVESPAANNANTQSKRKKLDRGGNDSQLADTEDELNDDTPAGKNSPSPEWIQINAPGAIEKILQAMLSLHQSTAKGRAFPVEISAHIARLCHVVQDAVNGAQSCPVHTSSKKDTVSLDLQDLCSHIDVLYSNIVSVVSALPSTNAHTAASALATASITSLFQALLGYLHKLVLDEITRKEEQELNKKRKPRPNTKALKKSPEFEQGTFEQCSAAMTRTLGLMLTTLDLDDINRCQLFKSLLTALLDHIGSSLSLLVFADQPLDRDDTLVEQPCGLQHVSHVDTNAAIAAAELEAPYLVTILKHSLGFLRQNHRCVPLRSQEIWADKTRAFEGEIFLQKIEKRLQSTLLRGVFGDDDETFREAFTRAPSPEDKKVQETIDDAKEEESKSHWFIGQLWELLGWDMLSGRMVTTSQQK